MRYWINSKEDDGSIHCLGNGKLAVYEQGPDIIQVFGPPYSSPSFMRLKLCEAEGLAVVSEREPGTAVWKHTVSKDGVQIGEMIDFVDSEIPCMVRIINLQETMNFNLYIENKWKAFENTKRYSSYDCKMGIMFAADAGISVYQHASYPSPVELTHQLLGLGTLEAIWNEECNCLNIECYTGESTIFIFGGPGYPDCIRNTEEGMKKGYHTLLNRTRRWWETFTSKRLDFQTLLPASQPFCSRLMNTIDDIAILVKTQQSIEGGVLAGHNYHLGYVRDQYGVARCLLKLGYFDEAKAILKYYWQIWKRYGVIHNAQALGVDGVFHIHENDEVEITGYLIIQAFDYFDKAGDNEFINEILPMLEWAWSMQKKHLVKYMLPFNGDETYIAGGILPRNTINDGSAEATLLFITSGEKLLKWLEEKGLWDKGILLDDLELLNLTKRNFRENFLKEEGLLTNNPERANCMQLPRFRHGVCEGCNSFGWTEVNTSGRYVCNKCYMTEGVYSSESVHYYVQSVCLMPLYIGSSLFTKAELSKMIEGLIKKYQETGKLPSRPDGNVTVGYDYGLLLYNLTELGHPLAGELFDKMFLMLDSAGAWVEYYECGKPASTRCRPWESSINLEAAIHYALKLS